MDDKRFNCGILFLLAAPWIAFLAAYVAPLQAQISSPVMPVGSAGVWRLIYQDEFEGAQVNPTQWVKCYWQGTPAGCETQNSELEWFSPNNVSVSGGILKLEARREAVTSPTGHIFDYTSGMITSGRDLKNLAVQPKFVFKYGFAEIKAKIPAGQGYWSAFWLMPEDQSSPYEIDALEILGHEPNRVHMHYHFRGYLGQDIDNGVSWRGPDFSAGWHTFGIEWQPTYLKWFVDGVETRPAYTTASHIANIPMYLIANLAVGGSWPGAPDNTTVFPDSFEIDYIRVWSRPEHNLPMAPSDGNLLRNPSFERLQYPWAYPWRLDVKTGAAGSVVRDTSTHIEGNAAARINITLPNLLNWSITWAQSSVPFQAGKDYKLKFWAKAVSTRQLGILVQDSEAPYTQYLNTAVELTTTWNEYQLDFNPTVSVSNGKIAFSLAQDLGQVWFDSIYFGLSP